MDTQINPKKTAEAVWNVYGYWRVLLAGPWWWTEVRTPKGNKLVILRMHV